MSDVTCDYVSADGRRDGLWWPALPGHWLSYTGCGQSLLMFLCWDAVSIFNHLPRIFFLSTDFALPITDWTCCHGPHLHAILRIFSRGVSGLATDSPCGVGAVDKPLASCMIVHISAHISKWELVCKFGVIFNIFIISCLCSRFHAWNQWFFYSIIRSFYSFLLSSYVSLSLFKFKFKFNYIYITNSATYM